jgi:phenylacetate-CoA ligase
VGEVVITPLVNRAMPLLRYRLGDVARLSNEPCACGRGSRVLESVEGRVWSLLRTSDGRVIYPGIVDKVVFTLLPDIERYQAIQDTVEHLTVKIVSRRPIDADRLRALADELAAALGAPTRVDIELVHKIDPELSGKYVFIKSLVPPP